MGQGNPDIHIFLTGQLLDERLEELLSRFRLSFQNVTIRITRNTYQTLMDEMHSNEIDIVYLRYPFLNHPYTFFNMISASISVVSMSAVL